MRMSESIAELSKALSKFQEEVKQPAKDADNPFFKSKYVPLDNVVETINKYGPKNGLSYTQWAVTNETGKIGVATLLMHSSGEFIEFDPLFMVADKQTAQGAGSVITYGRRYSLSAVYGIASETDDDANHASGNSTTPKSNNQSGPNPASEKQKKMLSAKATEFGKMRSKSLDEVIEALQASVNFKSMDTLSSIHASASIKLVESWIEAANKKS